MLRVVRWISIKVGGWSRRVPQVLPVVLAHAAL
jgi:hypothetical protein